MVIGRRSFTAGLAGTMLPLPAVAGDDALSPWRPGTLDVHHLSTGRGDATLIVAPSGQAALIDVGSAGASGAAMVDPLPDHPLSAGRQVARYVKRRLAETGRRSLDTLAITHFHDDHIGGVADLLDELEVATVLDRAWPDYGYPPFEGPAGAVYADLMRRRARAGGTVRRLAVGSDDQVLRPVPGAGRAFAIRTAAASGVVWTGRDRTTRSLFPPPGRLAAPDIPNENAWSAAFLVTSGRFRYFLGGDLTDWADAGTRPWLNALTPAARACGPVHVSTLPHHGLFDASSAATVTALGARDWVISAWHATHPSIETLERVYNSRLYAGPRDVWATAIHPATDLALARLTNRFAARRGNIVVRVAEGGDQWRMAVTEPGTDRLLSQSEPRRVGTQPEAV